MIQNKEYGSDFHWIESGEFRDLSFDNQLDKNVTKLYSSGRVALYDILSDGIVTHQWKNLFVPTYYCLEVYEFLKNMPINIFYYNYNPITKQEKFNIPDDKENVVLVVNYFGIETPVFENFQKVMFIEDLTHDLSKISSSKADYVFGSLRKVLPVPVGGFSKGNFQINSLKQVTQYTDFLSTQKATAMFLKSEYLKGNYDDKKTFRKLYIEAEEMFGDKESISLLPLNILEYLKTIRIDKIIDKKKDNLQLLKQKLIFSDKYNLISTEDNSDLACIFYFKENEERDSFRKYLISKNIYPMVLWPNQNNLEDRRVEDCLLFIHIDFRYSKNDIEYIANVINEYIK